MKVTVTPTPGRILTLEATLPELIELHGAVTATGRRTAPDKAILAAFAAALATDPDVAAAIPKPE